MNENYYFNMRVFLNCLLHSPPQLSAWNEKPTAVPAYQVFVSVIFGQIRVRMNG